MAIWAIAQSGDAPCQCFSPGWQAVEKVPGVGSVDVIPSYAPLRTGKDTRLETDLGRS
jgi:hypothetical protein